MNLGETIYQYRINKNLSQGDLAEKLDVSRQSVSKWENNSAVPDLDKIIKLCDIFEISIDELVKGKHSQNECISEISINENNDQKNLTAKNNSNSKTAGIILLCMAFITCLLCSFFSGFITGVILCSPFLVCGIICCVAKKNAGLWCAWAIYFMLDVYLRMATGIQRNSVYYVFYRANGQRYMTISVIVGWALMISMAVLTCITVYRFKNNTFILNKKSKTLLIVGAAVAVIIKILQLIWPNTAFYTYYQEHIRDLTVLHTIIYGLLDWIKVIVVIILIVNFARINFKLCTGITLSVIAIYFIVNFVTNLKLAEEWNINEAFSDKQSFQNNQLYNEKTLYVHGMDIISMLNEMINSEEYIQAFTGSADLITVIKDISKGNYFIPQNVYKITLDAESILDISEMLPSDSSDNLRNHTKNRLLNSIVTQINSRGGVNKLAATSICTAGKTFVSNELETEMIYLYMFENSVPVAVTFTKGENNAVNATGSFVFFDELNFISTQELLEYLGAYSVEVEVINP